MEVVNLNNCHGCVDSVEIVINDDDESLLTHEGEIKDWRSGAGPRGIAVELVRIFLEMRSSISGIVQQYRNSVWSTETVLSHYRLSANTVLTPC